ncbi:MAG: hypothetical protein A3I24_01320 [Candidatus Harrisonbacteria bacterium RIFCSPLOWO2_02_FULL_41_13b]|uniref:SIS domain-containing protein n=1 Tax=Candidatus Harrisonbacteria bacterium RIFCSPLOWO2_02_FULL_41_13b TaxID=1798409 RepID=A0A1G1ZTC4_9BACT|nr:MAG: hypothetical protein A3J53_03200 [Candidatus Harrisonbacteria bacterium RIFCSPHIGHO2_02_FULL_40_20]OGY67802.1 MAG: hypothetical protein A3I24_01320 [Candidatus Harrisonbacteria bacterium RIFCSPLOWO2_02_FULL_41_13b]
MDIFEKNILELNRQLTLKAVSFNNLEKVRNAKPDSILIIGMGGSGIVGPLLQNLIKNVNIKIPVITWNDYSLPDSALGKSAFYKNPLLVFVSFSGNTQETLDGFAKAKNHKLKVVVSGGGKLLSLAKKQKIAFATFEKNSLAPRQANGLMFYGTLGLLKAALPATKIIELSSKINSANYRLIGKKLASQIQGKVAVIYSTVQNRHLGYLWKIHLNEAGKNLAFNNVLPEMHHNEIVSFETKPKNVIAILLTTENDSAIHKIRFQITKKVLNKYQIPSIHIFINGKDNLERTFNTIANAQWCAYYLAKNKGLDPLETKTIDFIKSLL